jgi:O-antigen/teichoic acid export membrane protein
MFISATLLAMGPYLYVTAVLIPSRVQPFPDADGAWAPVEDFATFAWSLVDFGMLVAFVKHFAEWRVAEPARALQAAQAWIWWQLAGGLVLIVVGGAFACGVLPHTRYALFSRVVLIRAAMQVPGIFSFFTIFFSAIQRFDFQLLLDLLEKRLLFVATPIPFVLYFRSIGRAHPALGESFGAVLGIAAGQYCALILTFTIGYTLFRRLRLPLAPLVYAGFDRATVGKMLRFGAGMVAGKAPYLLAITLEFMIISYRLPGYLGWLGIRQLIMQRIVFTVYFLLPFTESAVPAIAESLAAKKRALTRYYVVRYLQFGHLFGAIVVAVLLGAGRPLILRALATEWRPVAAYLPLACASALLLPASWLVDAFQRGAGRPGLNSAIVVTEMTLRLALYWLLIPRLGFAGIFVATFIGLALKTAVAWLISHRLILRLEAWPWTSTLAPLASGALVYLALVGAAALLPQTRAAGIALFVGAALAAFPLGFFLVGIIGGLDAAAVDELRSAAELASLMRPVARRLAQAGALGARLHGRRALPALATTAQREADEIVTAERVVSTS